MSDQDDDLAAKVAALADSLGAPVRPEHLHETARAWAAMAAHRRLVVRADLRLTDEPAPVFRP